MHVNTSHELELGFAAIDEAKNDDEREARKATFNARLHELVDAKLITIGEFLDWAETLRNEYAPFARGSGP